MKRYDIEAGYAPYEDENIPTLEVEEDPQGEWVKLADHEAEVKRLQLEFKASFEQIEASQGLAETIMGVYERTMQMHCPEEYEKLWKQLEKGGAKAVKNDLAEFNLH